jgi:hypothetical protein
VAVDLGLRWHGGILTCARLRVVDV